MLSCSTSCIAAGAAEPQARRLEAILARVFPAGTRLARNGGGERRTLVVVSDSGGPRWLLPGDPRATGEVLAGWTPFGLRTRLEWWLVRHAYALRLLPRLPGRIGRIALDLPAGADFAHLGWRGAAPVVLVQIGRPGPWRKALVTLVDPSRRQPPAIAKLALGERAAAAIAREAAILARLGRERPGLAPALLDHDPRHGRSLLAWLPGRPSGRRLSRAHRDWLAGLQSPGTSASLALDRLPDAAPAALVEAQRRLAAQDRLPGFWLHGDFAPWNVKRGPDGSLGVVDWEEARPEAPPLQDLLYFHYNQSVLLDRRPGLDALAREVGALRAFLARIGVAPARLGDLVLHFLACQWLQRCERGEAAYAALLLADLERQLRGDGL